LRGTYSGFAGTNVFGPSGIQRNPQPTSANALIFAVAATNFNPNPLNSFTLSEFSIELS
jgi:hypothetical protein